MYITTRGRTIRIHDAKTGSIKSIKEMPEEVQNAQLQGDIITVTMSKRIHVLKRIGSSYNFSFFRALNK